MKITKRQLRGIIREALVLSRAPESMAWPHDGQEETRLNAGVAGGVKRTWPTWEPASNDAIMSVLEEMGYDLASPLTMSENQSAIRDAMAGYRGEFTYPEIENAVRAAGGVM